MVRVRWAALYAFVAAELVGCASEPPPPAAVDLASRQCATTPDLGSAVSLRYDRNSSQDITVTFDQSAPCLVDKAGAKDLYKVFALPKSPDPYLITIEGMSWGNTVFAARALLLGGDGVQMRSAERTDFTFRGTSYSTILRSHPGEAYLVVASDAGAAGKQFSQITDSTSVAYGGGFYVHTGSESVATQTFAQTGKVKITISPVPIK